MEKDKTPGSVTAFRALVDGIVGDATPAPDLTPTPYQEDPNEWKRKTAPPTFCAVALADARNDPIVRNWKRKRVEEITPAINYKASRLAYLDRLHDMTEDDARQQMTINAMVKAEKDPLWFCADNPLIAHDAAQRVRVYQGLDRKSAQKWYSYSLDEYTNSDQSLTRLDTLAASLARSWLTFAPYAQNRQGQWVDAKTEQSELVQAMRALPDAQCKSFTLARFWNIPTLEIAAALGMPRNTVISHNHRAKKSLAVSLAHLDYNRARAACPSCGSRNVKSTDKGKFWNCRVCDRAGLRAEFEKRPTDRIYWTGRQIESDPMQWDRVPAASYPMPPRPRPAKMGPTIPNEYAPTIQKFGDSWTPPPPPPPEKWDRYLSPPFPGGKSQRDLDSHCAAYDIGPLFDIKTRRQWYGTP